MAAPIQVVINPHNFHEDRDKAGGGPSTDFFAGRDTQFEAHRNAFADTLLRCAEALDRKTGIDGGIGTLKIILRREAWAKSHRPFRALFKPRLTPCIGGLDLGQLLVRVTPESLRSVADAALAAEPTTTWRRNASGKLEPYPSRARSEIGAIDRVELYGPGDRRKFEIEAAVAWLSRLETGQSYEVELFEAPRPVSAQDTLPDRERMLFRSFHDGLIAFGNGLAAVPIPGNLAGDSFRMALRIGQSTLPALVQLVPAGAARSPLPAPFDPTLDRHAQLLSFLEQHPLVRSISLPAKIERSVPVARAALSPRVALSVRDRSRIYPRVGVIDGGVSDVVSDWIVGRWAVLDDNDIDASHGTFISGLLIAGTQLNSGSVIGEVDGVEIYDARVLPTDATFSTYYSNLDGFFDEVEQAIIDARNRFNVRVFNLSLNVSNPVAPDRYSRWASRLDAFADEHDVIIFISIGNYDNLRSEWPEDPAQALAHLAAVRDDTMHMPAESARNAAVGALNPPHVPPILYGTPTSYTRRGPGLRSLVKPDFAHIGGAGRPHVANGYGLYSLDPTGALTTMCGTSFATPLVAKTAARLDLLVEGGLSRETMLALLIHHARQPELLRSKPLSSVARHFIGFGQPPTAAEMLEGNDHEITLVFATRLPPGKQLIFPFTWPPSLARNGSCRGYAKLTLVSSPPLDARFGAEFVRVNVDAALQQFNPDKLRWEGRLRPCYLPAQSSPYPFEAERIEHEYKWNPVKCFDMRRRGVGKSSDWRLQISYVARADVEIPENGIPFTAVLTIADPDTESPVFDQMRQWLSAQAVRLEDIRTAARVVTRV